MRGGDAAPQRVLQSVERSSAVTLTRERHDQMYRLEGHSGSSVDLVNSLAEKEELRRGDQQEGWVVVMATDEED